MDIMQDTICGFRKEAEWSVNPSQPPCTQSPTKWYCGEQFYLPRPANMQQKGGKVCSIPQILDLGIFLPDFVDFLHTWNPAKMDVSI